jgi:hypothetical protein
MVKKITNEGMKTFGDFVKRGGLRENLERCFFNQEDHEVYEVSAITGSKVSAFVYDSVSERKRVDSYRSERVCRDHEYVPVNRLAHAISSADVLSLAEADE